MGHPALWLSPIGRRRQPDEINQAYIVRLWLELLVRGYLEDHSDDQGWMDVLRLAGWSPGDPELDRRLLDYADGADDDDELNYLELAPGMLPELPPDWIQINSAALYYQHELAYQEVLALQHERVALGVQQAQDALARANPTLFCCRCVRLQLKRAHLSRAGRTGSSYRQSARQPTRQWIN